MKDGCTKDGCTDGGCTDGCCTDGCTDGGCTDGGCTQTRDIKFAQNQQPMEMEFTLTEEIGTYKLIPAAVVAQAVVKTPHPLTSAV